MIASVIAIYLALVFQFRNAIKPFIVFAGIPFGAVGAFASLWLTGRPMGFLAILGITSLIGVIVSHVIVLFDFIEEQRERGAPLRDALIDAGIRRIRPVLITVGATVLALFPLALNGGPLWEALLVTPRSEASRWRPPSRSFSCPSFTPYLCSISRLSRWSQPDQDRVET